MTIKKPIKAKSTTTDAPVVAGGATIADRLKLDMPDPAAAKTTSGGPAATIAGVAGLLALAVAGILTYVLWQHWEFLMPA